MIGVSFKRIFNSSNRLRQDLLPTLAASLSLAFTLLIFNAAAARILGVEAFGLLQTVRQLATILVPILTLSQAIALPRFMASENRGDSAFVVGLEIFMTICGFAALVVLALAALPHLSGEHREILVFASILALGMGNARLVESGLRGYHDTRRANLIKGPVNGLIHLAALLILVFFPHWSNAIVGLLIGYGALMFLTLRLLIEARKKSSSEETNKLRRKLLVFGLGRTPAGLLKSLVFGLPFIIFSVTSDFEGAAIFALGLYFVRVSEAVVTGISPSIVYQTVRLNSGGGDRRVPEFVASLTEGVAFLSAAILTFIVFWRVDIVALVFGDKYLDSITSIAMLSLAIVPYCLFVVLRGVVDVLHERPINTFIIALALLVEIGLVYALPQFMSHLDSVIVAVLSATIIMALGGVVSAGKVILTSFSFREWVKIVITIASVWIINFLAGKLAIGWLGLSLGLSLSIFVVVISVVAFNHRWYVVLFSRRGSL